MNTKALKVFFIYAIVLAVFSFFSLLAVYFFKSRSAYILIVKIYNIFEYSLFAIFLSCLFRNLIVKRITLISIIPFVLISLVSYYMSTSTNYNNYPSLIEFLIFIIFIIYFFYEKMNTVVEYPLYQSISFWICMGLFIYFTGNFFFFLFINSSKDKQFLNQMRVIYGVVTICKNIMLCVAFFAEERIDQEENAFQIPNEIDLDSFNPKTNLN